eukprot:TRINITY_DN7817_c0_g1_i3.p1 TRINITY_DN7817_c0_g1~~TRINITY_DN7817_c0_g1_i3.p1  ORF type:complete len:153 (-),score=32.06 TRINITY_DN7817_c0_g1_i3:49-507(-)
MANNSVKISETRATNLHNIAASKNSKAAQWLMKMGWSAGKGLGKNLDGNVDFVKISLKKDSAGIGTSSERWEKWWEKGFDEAARNTPSKQKKPKEKPKKIYGGTFISKAAASDSEESEVETEKDTNLFEKWRYWSWNYRGCWHQTCPPIDPN